ncbi:GGDEF domain-containing protein [Sulfurimonas sp.]|uniref:GGDEF domain-containing protein n=1 Tax=Sulfurimonas sp. TaxID=2022749 RepID=UPI0039E3580E
MDETNLSQDLISIQENEAIPYEELVKFADNPDYLNMYVQKYGQKLYQQCIFSLTHISINESLSEIKWEHIVDHRKKLNDSLNRDVGLKVAAIDYLENISDKDFEMTVMENDKVDNIVDVATIDQLTSLYVRSMFDEMLKQEFQQYLRNNQKLSIMMLDIDDFKHFNDTYGHQGGDEALTIIGSVLLNAVRKSDIASRYGGEEFVVIMPQTDIQTAFDVAQRIRQKIEDTDIDGKSLTISIGVSETSASVKSAEELLKMADDALYQAKENGKNQVVQANES